MSSSNDYGDRFSTHMGTQNNNTGSGNQFPGASFSGTVNMIQNIRNEPSLESRGMDVLKRLNVSKYRDQKDRNPVRIPGTCVWFTTHPIFEAWQETRTSRMLWVSANPGCGKSVLAKYLADSVVTCRAGRTVGYFFFRDDFEDQRSIVKALCCILHQLFYHNRDLLTERIIEQFEMDEGIVGSFSDLWNVLISAAKQKEAGEIICLLDALDECEQDGWSQLTEALQRLYIDETRNTFNLKFLITSRLYGRIRHGFQPLQMPGQPLVHLSGENDEEMEKISREIDLFIQARVNTIGAQLRLTEEEQSILLKSVTRVSNRTYLWVYLTLNVIQSKMDIDKIGIVAATSDLPKTVDEAYERILSRSKDRRKARKLLHIVIGATRPLTLQEMNIALILHERHQSYGDLDLGSQDRFQENMRDLCGLFITVVEGKIYLLHQTAREFLVQENTSDSTLYVFYHTARRILFRSSRKERNDNIQSLSWKHSITLKESHRIIATICIQYLLLSDFGKAWPLATDLGELTDSYILLDYAAKSWVTHHLEANTRTENMEQPLLALCDLIEGHCPAWFQVYWASMFLDFPSGFTSLIIASYFGLIPVVKHWIEMDATDLDAKDYAYGRSALSWAAGNGHTTIIKLLIEGSLYRPWRKTAEVDARDNYNRTPLSWAILNGHVDAVSLLLKAGAAVDLKDDIGGTPIHYAICNEEIRVWSLLMEKEFQHRHLPNERIKMELLISAAKNGHEPVVKMLLKSQANIESRDSKYGRTPLSWAAGNDHEAVVRLLLENRADVELKDKDNRTPLSWAAENGHEAVVRLLLESNADIESKDKDNQTPLFYAADSGRIAVVRLLLENNADIESKDKCNQTPLFYAASRGHEAVSARWNASDNRGGFQEDAWIYIDLTGALAVTLSTRRGDGTWIFGAVPRCSRGGLRHVFQSIVINEQSSKIMRQAIGEANGFADWDKYSPMQENVRTFQPGANEYYYALLYSSNAHGIGWLLTQHKAQMGLLTVSSIIVSGEDGDVMLNLKIDPVEQSD
ncbi:ankyrin repeat-containing protein [Aspergillus arachidicola]|uniref:Ankyrin repeat-containing protein n=1 Tax=Aspergillus arachidicola TaxID=656916 RepID=A0A2G7FFG0_9EURO|nr:ankyrin repeat-containing protein [Aspergillus arachidicola]